MRRNLEKFHIILYAKLKLKEVTKLIATLEKCI